MSIATVVTRGYGSFGSVYGLPVLGYLLDANVVIVDGPFCADYMLTVSGKSSRLQSVAYKADAKQSVVYKHDRIQTGCDSCL